MRQLLLIAVFCLFSVSAFAASPMYTLTVDKAPVKAGKTTLTIKIHKVEGRKVNTDFPAKLTFTPPAGITPAKAEYRRADFATFTESDLIVTVPVAVQKAGSLPFTFKFGTCAVENGQVKSCVPHTHTDKIDLKP